MRAASMLFCTWRSVDCEGPGLRLCLALQQSRPMQDEIERAVLSMLSVIWLLKDHP